MILSEAFDDALAFLKKAGWTVNDVHTNSPHRGAIEEGGASASSPQGGPYGWQGVSIWMRRIYTPPAEIDRELRKSCSNMATERQREPRLDSVQVRTVNGHPLLSCFIDTADKKSGGSEFYIWVRTESLILRFTPNLSNVPIFRWMFEPVLDTIKLP